MMNWKTASQNLAKIDTRKGKERKVVLELFQHLFFRLGNPMIFDNSLTGSR